MCRGTQDISCDHLGIRRSQIALTFSYDTTDWLFSRTIFNENVQIACICTLKFADNSLNFGIHVYTGVIKDHDMVSRMKCL